MILEKEHHLKKISNGTTIDHIPAGKGLKLLKILGLDGKSTVSMALNVDSARLGKKDLIFLEGTFIEKNDSGKVFLAAKDSTINTIRNSKVDSKARPELPESMEGIILCQNQKCISAIEGIPSKFSVKKGPLKAKCIYCEKELSEKEILGSMG